VELDDDDDNNNNNLIVYYSSAAETTASRSVTEGAQNRHPKHSIDNNN
jgi:hypothetical protein